MENNDLEADVSHNKRADGYGAELEAGGAALELPVVGVEDGLTGSRHGVTGSSGVGQASLNPIGFRADLGGGCRI